MANPKSAKPLDANALTDAQLEALLAQRKADAAAAAAKVEEERVAALKAQHESLNSAYQTAMGALADFTVALSPEDAAILGIKSPIARVPKGVTEKALSAYLATLEPGTVFERSKLPETATLGASDSTVRNALKALGIRPVSSGKGSKYHVPGAVVAESTVEVPSEVPAREPVADGASAEAPAEA